MKVPLTHILVRTLQYTEYLLLCILVPLNALYMCIGVQLRVHYVYHVLYICLFTSPHSVSFTVCLFFCMFHNTFFFTPCCKFPFPHHIILYIMHAFSILCCLFYRFVHSTSPRSECCTVHSPSPHSVRCTVYSLFHTS